jgi:hypothetical protein
VGATAVRTAVTIGDIANESGSPIMPEDHSDTDTSRGDTARTERSRRDKSATANGPSGMFGEIGTNSVKAGLRVQKEMFEVLHDIGNDWLARATSRAELAFKLPSKLSEASTVPDALSAYREWFGEWVTMMDEDGRHLISDGQKIVDYSVRCFTTSSPSATT